LVGRAGSVGCGLIVTERARIAVAPQSGLDILVFVPHLKLGAVELDALTGRMLGELRWPDLSSRITLVVADDSRFEVGSGDPVAVVQASEAATMFRDRCRILEGAPHDILIAFGAYLPTGDVIRQLRAAISTEELISAIAPRIAIGLDGELMMLGGRSAASSSGMIDARYASQLLPAYYFPELLCPCMLVSARMIGNVDIPDDFSTFPDLILALLRAGRRRGFLIRIDNRLTVPADRQFDAEALPHETAKLLQLFPDHERTRRRLVAHPAHADERRFQVILKSSSGAAGSLLLDCTNIPPSFSGSADHMLGVLSGMAKIERRAWDLSVMVTTEARSFFSLDDRFSDIRFLTQSDGSFYDCAIRLSQPWSISTLADLNRRARSIAVTIHDSIGPDVIYAVPEEAEEAFQFAAEHSDGMIYISEFSRDQFARRFVRRPGLVESVIYSSLVAAEYVHDAGASGEWLLIFGNAYDHKDLARTTKIASAAFPYERIKVVGRRDLGGLNVEAFDSGALENEVVEELFRRAKCVVFPSFYEGFGLPLMKGLAYGKAVIARRSRVFREAIARFPNSGRLIEFENSLELVQAVGKVLHGKVDMSFQQQSDAAGAPHHGWKECAAQILQFAERMQKSEDVDVWRARDRALRYVKARGQ